MLFPSIFGENLYSDLFGDSFTATRTAAGAMKTDVKETDGGYELAIDLPGVKKEDICADLKDGYLTVKATTSQCSDDKDDSGCFIRRERYCGTFSRSFYVGDAVTEKDIKAKYHDGVLTLDIPKKEPVKKLPEDKIIAIEG
ncbi:MAG: Hsp20/alpha crystallin family protein [Oscillospiraceae bacterium]|nr:Hsp20/alpha crystallin family protein [Oscillospiraceae bacterium]